MWAPAQGYMGRTHSSLSFVQGDTWIKGRGAGRAVRGMGKHSMVCHRESGFLQHRNIHLPHLANEEMEAQRN